VSCCENATAILEEGEQQRFQRSLERQRPQQCRLQEEQREGQLQSKTGAQAVPGNKTTNCSFYDYPIND